MKAFLIILFVVIVILFTAGYFFFRFSCKVHGGLSFDGNGKDPYHDRRAEGKKFLDACRGKDAWIESGDGLKLHGLFIQNKQADKVVLCAHGYRGSAYGDFAGSAQMLVQENCDLLLIDERGCGKSEGEYITFGVKEKDDILQWLKWLRTQTDLPVYLYGVSMGSSAVCLCADQKQIDVRGIIADCGYSSAYQIMTDCCRSWFHIPGYPLIWFVDFWSILIAHAPLFTANVKKALQESNIPVLLIHGTDDDFVLPKHAKINYEACSSEKKKLVWIKGAGHAVSSLHDPDEYQKALHAFFMETMQKEEA